MSDEEKKYDIVVFGASGVTGKFVVEELAKHHENLKWCIAGRSKEKLIRTLKEVSDLADKDLSAIDIIVADFVDDESLSMMCKQAKLLINCVGPYRFFGEKVVKFCVEEKTHCVDVSGEPQFLESVQLEYFDAAREKGVYIVGSCGFDSIPCDLGVEMLRKKFDGDLNSVETFLGGYQPPGTTVNFATWQSAIHGLANAQELKPLRKALKEKVFKKHIPRPDYPLKPRGKLFKCEEAKSWCIPFLGSDKSVITRTQLYNYNFRDQKPVQIQTYFCMKSLATALVTILLGAIFMMLAKFPMGRYLLEKFPEVFSLGYFSRTPPSREKCEQCSFRILFRGRGWSEKLLETSDKHTQPPNKVLNAVLTGPDPAYITTSICVVNAAVTILTEKLPLTGGVFTPASAFADTSLMQKLATRGILFELENHKK